MLTTFLGSFAAGSKMGRWFDPALSPGQANSPGAFQSESALNLTATPTALSMEFLAASDSAIVPRGGDGSPAPAYPALPGQVTFVVIGVDDLQAVAHPQLQAVWFILFRPPTRRVFVLGLSPYTLAVPQGHSRLRLGDAFERVDGRPATGDIFWRSLESVVPLSPQAALTLDRKGFSRLLELSGGAVLGGETISPAQAMAWLEEQSAAGPAEALNAQTELLRGMLAASASLSPPPAPTSFPALAGRHLQLSQPLEYLLRLAAPMLPLNTTEVFVEAASGNLNPTAFQDGNPAIILSRQQ